MAQTTELWDIYDSDRNPTGRVEPRGRLVIGDYHLVVHIWLMNEKGEILVTQRAQNNPWGLFWETTGGSVLAGETSLQAAVREVREEVGIQVKHIRYYGSQPWGMSGNLTLAYTAELDGGDRLTVDRTELAEARWFFRDQVPIRKEDRVSITQDMVRAFAAGRF